MAVLEFYKLLLIHIVYPEIVNISSNTVATEGHTVLLHCTGYGNPLPSIMWYYSDTTINYHNTTTTNMYTVHSVLVLTNVSSHGSGVYRCQLTSVLNITSHDIVLTVQGMLQCTCKLFIQRSPFNIQGRTYQYTIGEGRRHCEHQLHNTRLSTS